MTYGDLNQIYNRDSGKFEWYLKSEDPSKQYPLFELNMSGTLFIPYGFYRTVSDLFGFEYKRETDKAIAECWDRMFGLYPERVNVYFE